MDLERNLRALQAIFETAQSCLSFGRQIDTIAQREQPGAEDEPDSQRVAITVPDSMIDVSNGRLRNTTRNANGTTTYEWFVTSPINNYDVAVNAGNYAHYTETYSGEA